MKTNDWLERHRTSLMDTFGTPHLVLDLGKGSTVWDVDGKKYLDLLGGIAVNALGHAHPAVVEAVAQQVARLGHVSNFFATEPQVRLAEEILRITAAPQKDAPGDGLVFLTNSGTEANEAALKVVKAHGNAQSTPKQRIIALDHAFHGRSTGALALTWKAAYREPFAPLVPGVHFVPAGDAPALEAAMGPEVAAVFVEPIQGEAGVNVLTDDYLRAVREITTGWGALMVVDEVQTGVGRTGEWMGHHHAGIRPDLVTLAKGLGGGMPVGACVAFGEAAHILRPGMHGTTFGGNPVCAAAALAVIRTIEAESLLEHVKALGESWREDLRTCGAATLVDVRGRGLLIGLEFSEPIAPALVAAGREAGFVLNATGANTLRLAPPLVITEAEAAGFTAALPKLAATALERTSKAMS
ncbi:acetylornithine transaminase [Schaalia sp. 19OD2882]|uniref:acetylornithine transaminase n=1 Tax=Schaalia sp. 19OD2882 TaxID=2794089 RepID=UPI001C1EA35A|nr:acetylornithine transaminase [Schaalia sp. 19OD2882]QWW18777.1 acetylornithine transaminase [Schaalia sp. 19OD2882]